MTKQAATELLYRYAVTSQVRHMLACAAIARTRYYHAPGSVIAKAIRVRW